MKIKRERDQILKSGEIIRGDWYITDDNGHQIGTPTPYKKSYYSQIQQVKPRGAKMQIQTIKFTKSKETGEIYGKRTVRADCLISDPEQA